MRGVYGAEALPRLVVMLREPSERLHSAFWEYSQYRTRHVGGSYAGSMMDGMRGGRVNAVTALCCDSLVPYPSPPTHPNTHALQLWRQP